MERKCQNCRCVDVCLKRSLAIFNMFIVTGRYNEVENAKKSLDVSVRSDAIAIIEREQSKGRFESELDTAIGIALHALKEPREMCCGGCQRFGDEDANGVGWCEEHDREAYCDEPPCGYFE